MKKVLALVMVIFMLAAMTNIALADYTKPADISATPFDDATAFGGAASTTGGLWSSRTAGAYDPELDTLSIPEAAYVYSYGNESAPDSVAGYTKVDSVAALQAGQYAIHAYDSAYGALTYLILVPADDAGGAVPADDVPAIEAPADDVPAVGGESALPAELASAYPVGVWPLVAGQYDPSLDGQGIPDGANVFGLYDSSFTTMLDAPAAIEGYTAVTAPADLAPGSYYVLLGGAGFNYVVIVGADGPITAAPPPPPAAPDVPVVDEPVVEAPVVAAAEVYITIVNNGQVEVAAQPIIPDEMTIEGVLLKAHETWYKDGVSGYSAGIDPTFNMYLIESAWGVTGVPFISQGEAMMGSTPVNAVAVAPGDNIIMTTTGAAMAVTLTATAGETDSEIVVTAKSQTFDISTYGYMAGKLSGARVIDSAGNELGTTDSDGVIVITLPEGDELEAWDGVVIVEGAAAINVKASISEPNVIDPDARKVYVSVSLDGVLAYAAETVTVTNSDELGEQRTIEGVIKVAHEMFYSGGVDGYGPNLFWGVAWDSSDTTKANRPKIALNDRLIDLSDPAALQTTVRSDDNILFSIATNPQATPRAIWITCYINGIIAYGEAYELTEGPDGTVIKTPIVDAALVDGTTGPGTAPVPLTDPNLSVMDENNTGVRTDENGHFEVNTPTSGRIGIIAIEGYAAMNTIYSADYPLFKGPDGRSMLFLLVIAVIALIPLLSIVLHAQSTEIKNRGVKFSKSALGGKLGGSKLK